MLLHHRLAASTVVALAAVWGSVVGAGAARQEPLPREGSSQGPAVPAPAGARPGLQVFRGLATWVDLYNPGVWKRPLKAVDKMADKGVQTLYLETSNYKHNRAIVHRRSTGRFIDAAHEHGITVVAWYLPSFAHLRTDLRRSKAAVDFASQSGERFDSFALDIEATVVRDIKTRNRRMLALSRRLRQHVGHSYSLGAIVPDPAHSTYWPRFPYRRVARTFDVFLPMSYFTFRTSGRANVYHYISENIRVIRARTRNARIPIHVIGGIANHSSVQEVRGFVRAVCRHRAGGASLYDFPITGPRQWKAMTRVASLRYGVPRRCG